MGRTRSITRSRVPLHRRFLLDPALLRSWLLVAAGVILVAAAVGHLVAEARATTRRWGTTRAILVISRPVGAGADLATATEPARWPVALVPTDAVIQLPAGARAAGPLAVGTPVTKVAVASRSSAGGALGPGSGRSTIAVALTPAHLTLTRGDTVEIWATYDPSLAGGRSATRRVAGDAVVVSSRDRAAVLAVRRADVGEVARATATATITLVGTG